MEEEDSTIIYSTRPAIQEFIDSNVWLDLSNELDTWKTIAARDVISATGLQEVGRLQGMCEVIDKLKNLPQSIIDALTEVDESELDSQNEASDDGEEL